MFQKTLVKQGLKDIFEVIEIELNDPINKLRIVEIDMKVTCKGGSYESLYPVAYWFI